MKINTSDFDTQALREKILDLAMRGELVPQDSNDEPVSILLNKIISAKDKLVKEKKIKKSKPLPEITNDEKPFDIPDSWKWVRLGDIFDITSSKRVMKKEWRTSGIPFYRAREIVSLKKHQNLKDPIFISEDTYKEKLKASGKPMVNDVLLTGVGTLGIPYVVSDDKKFYFKDGNIIWLRNMSNSIDPCFISYYVQSPYMLRIINNGKGTTVGTLTIVRAKNLLVSLPPLAEQKRIADKISQLFDQIDKIESASQQYTELQSSLRFKVLDVAMHGKLVKQEPTDEPASILFDKIKAEKAELIKEKKIKKSKPLPEITDDEKPYSVPGSWEWVRLGDIFEIKGGKRVPKGMKLSDSHLPGSKVYIRVSDMQRNTVDFSNLKYADKTIVKEIARYTISSKDLYFSIAGSIGKVGTIPLKLDGALLTENSAKLKPILTNNTLKKYILYLLESLCIVDQYNEIISKVAQPKLALRKIRSLLVPLPPLEEQERIVTKLEKVFSTL